MGWAGVDSWIANGSPTAVVGVIGLWAATFIVLIAAIIVALRLRYAGREIGRDWLASAMFVVAGLLVAGLPAYVVVDDGHGFGRSLWPGSWSIAVNELPLVMGAIIAAAAAIALLVSVLRGRPGQASNSSVVRGLLLGGATLSIIAFVTTTPLSL